MHSLLLHMIEFSIKLNPNLDGGETKHAIMYNWEVNSYD